MYDLTWTDTLAILGTLIAAIVIGVLLSHTVGAIASRIGRPGGADNARAMRRTRLFARTRGPIAVIVALGVWQLALAFFDLPIDVRAALHGAGRVGLVLALVWLTLRVADLAIDALAARTELFAHHQASRALLPLGRRVAKILIAAVAGVALLGSLGYSVTGLIAGLGITGIAVALAAQKTLENLLGAFALGIDQPLREGDLVRVDQTVGTVERIGLRSTHMRTLDRTLVAYPNGKLADSVIERYSARDRMRFNVAFRLGLATTGAQLRTIRDRIEHMLAAHPERASDAPSVHLTGPGDAWFGLEAMSWIATEDWNKFQTIRDQLLLDCLEIISEAGATLHGAPPPRAESRSPEPSRQPPLH